MMRLAAAKVAGATQASGPPAPAPSRRIASVGSAATPKLKAQNEGAKGCRAIQGSSRSSSAAWNRP